MSKKGNVSAMAIVYTLQSESHAESKLIRYSWLGHTYPANDLPFPEKTAEAAAVLNDESFKLKLNHSSSETGCTTYMHGEREREKLAK